MIIFHELFLYFSTDVILLATAFATSMNLAHLLVKSTNTRTKKDTFINVESIATDLRSSAPMWNITARKRYKIDRKRPSLARSVTMHRNTMK